MGSFVAYHGATQPCERYCERCGARLSRYNQDYSEALCAPCHELVHPWQPPVLKTPVDELERRRQNWHRNASETCSCGSAKSRGAATCLRCYLNMITNKDPWHGPECPACGGHKAMDARICHQCRYPRGAL